MLRRNFTLIELMIVIAIIAIIAAIAIPNLLEARKSGNEAAALGSIKAIGTAQTLYREGSKGGGNFGTITELGSTKLIDSVLAGTKKQGYSFDSRPGATAGEEPYKFFIGAVPIVKGNTGDRLFVSNHTGVIFFTTTTPATVVNIFTCEPNDPALWSPIGK